MRVLDRRLILPPETNPRDTDMNARDYIITRQIQWAHRHGIVLQGSEGDRGSPAYTTRLCDNLFEPLTDQTRAAFCSGDGNELKPAGRRVPKMQALHSSSALVVNVFQYWQRVGEVAVVASACGLCSTKNTRSMALKFERKFEINKKFPISPNMDVAICVDDGTVFAIESKFAEPYGNQGSRGLKPVYLKKKDLWSGLENIRDLAKNISPDDNTFKYLHAAQLVKHLLGIKAEGVKKFRLCYLYYDTPGDEGAEHRAEIKKFEGIIKRDGVRFLSVSYQDVLARLAERNRPRHLHYIDFITDRYL